MMGVAGGRGGAVSRRGVLAKLLAPSSNIRNQ
jgi:hypothetical protein